MRKRLLSVLLAALVLVTVLVLSAPSCCIEAEASSASAVKIVTQPKSVTVCSGDTAKVTVKASGEGLRYQWYYKDPGMKSFEKSSITADTYQLTMKSSKDGRQLYCKITDKSGNSVKTNTVTLKLKVSIVTQPESVTVKKGGTVKITVKASGEGLTYTWYYKNLGASSFVKTDAFKGNTYSLKMTTKRHGRQVYCKVTDKYGNTVKTKTVTMDMKNAVKITAQPQSVFAVKGEAATTTVTATGKGLSYQWYYKDPGSKSFKKSSVKKATYSVDMKSSKDGRQIYCKITDKYGISVKTETVTLKMRVNIVTQPKSVTVEKGKTAKVTVKATGKDLTYTWYYKNRDSSEFVKTDTFKGRSYTVRMIARRHARQLYCKITDKYGNTVKTEVVTIEMEGAAKITSQPKSVVTAKGETAKTTVKATGKGLTYQWYYKNPGSNSFKKSSVKEAAYTVKMRTSIDGRQIYCKVTDKYGVTVKSRTVTLRIEAAIATQPKSVSADCGTTAKVTLKAAGVDLKYTWYYKNAGASKFVKTDTFDGDYYTAVMNTKRDGRQIYCVVTDKYGNTATSDIVTLTTDHSNDAGTVLKKATCSEEGSIRYTCAKCSAQTTKVIEKLSHSYGDWKVYREATVEHQGVERSTCSVCGFYKDRYTSKLKVAYYITVNTGVGDAYKVGVAKDGKYSLEDPERIGYVFKGWKTSKGADFASSGTISKKVTVNAVWELDGTDTLEELVERANAGTPEIKITGNITITEPVFISYETKIYADGDYTLTRSSNYAGDIFVVGQDSTGTPAVQLHRKAVLNLGGGKGTLTIDGNRDNLKVTVAGSALYVSDSAVLNLYDGVRISNHRKLSNDRALKNTQFVSEYTTSRAGGAAVLILNATVNMYGGVMENNAVYTEYTVVTNDDGTQSWLPTNGCGGAVYNHGNFNMYGGTITGSEALRGGGIYSDYVSYLHAGTISNNLSHSFGGGLSSSSGSNADIYVGTEGSSSEKMVFSGNKCIGPGGALYSNTSSPIIVLGNAVFENNTSTTSGGAIYTAGPLTVRNSRFSGNSSVGSGGAIYHHYTKAEFERRHLTLENCSFDTNKSNLGGAVILSSTGTAAEAGNGTVGTITNCTFTGNEAVLKETSTGSGGAIYITKSSDATITGCTFTKNSSTGNAGAVAAQGGTNVSLSNSTFTENSALQGGALYTAGADGLILEDLTFTGNSAVLNANGGAGLGGAMFIDRSPVTVKNIDLKNNTAGTHAGAVYLKAITLTLDADSEVSGNSAGQHGGAFYLTYYTDSEGNKTGAVLNAAGTVFSGNSAMAGGVVSARTACTVNMDSTTLTGNSVAGDDGKLDGDAEGGGAIYVGYGTATLKNVTATGNTAAEVGGAICAVSSTVTINDSTFSNNESLYQQSETFNSNVGGGAIKAANSTLTIKNTTLDGNKSGYYGGAVLAAGGTVTIDENTVVSGSSGATGAALYFKSGANVTISDITVKDTVSNGNGVIYQNSGVLNMSNVTATGNKAASGGVLFTSGASTQVTVKDSVWSGNSATSGGTIYMTDATVTVTNCEVKDNTAKYGGAVYNQKGTLEVADSTYSGNSATVGNGGAVCMSGGTVNVTGDSKFISNSAVGHAGGIYVSYFKNADETKVPAILNATGTAFEGNTAMGGGAISIRTDCEATVDNVTFTANTVTGDDGKADGYGEGGGAIYAGYGKLSVTNTTFTENTSSTFGGAVHTLETDTTVSGSTFTGNEGANGGAVYVLSTSAVSLSKNSFTGNKASSNGGALYIPAAATLTASELAFTENTAGSNGGAIYLQGLELNVDSGWSFSKNIAGGHGGAFYLTYKTNEDNSKTGAVLNATDVTFDSNTAMAGGAISARSACTVNLDGTILTGNSVTGYTGENDGDGEGGGAIYVGYGELNMTNVTATGNTATDFGGVVDAVGSPVAVTGGTFSGNSANNGGVIHAMSGSTATFDGTTLKENSSPAENKEYDNAIGGGAIHTVGGTLTLTATTMDGNTSENYGGTVHASKTTVKIDGGSTVTNSTGATGAALYFRNSSTVTMDDVFVTNNTSSMNGVIYQGGGTLTMSYVTATGNKAYQGGVLYTSGGAKVTLSGCEWSSNSATNGGAIYLKDNAAVDLVNSIMQENTAKYGGAVYVTEGGTLNLAGTDFLNNSATVDGGAIYNKGGNVIDADTETVSSAFIGNTSTKDGGAIYVVPFVDETTQTVKTAALNISGITLLNNSGRDGGAVYLTANTTAELSGLTFSGNSATGNGGALYVHSAGITASNLNFQENTAANHGGAIYQCAVELTVDSGWSFIMNSAGKHGGAVYLTYRTNDDNSRVGAVLNASDVSLSDNTAMAGGAISARSECVVNLNGTVLASNSVTGYADENDGDGEGGGAIYVGYGKLNMTNVTAAYNTATDFGGVVDAVASPVTVTGGSFANNSANNGGVIHAMSGSTVTFNGSALESNESPYQQGETYVSAIGGGAIHTVGGTLTLTGTTLNSNVSGYYGGAVHTYGTTVKIDGNSAVTSSTGATGAALYFIGNSTVTMENVSVTANVSNGNGVIYQSGGTLTMDNVTATANEANCGGVLYASGSGTQVTVKNSTWSGNSANEGGALYLKVKVAVDLVNCTLKENSAKYGGAAYVYDGGTLNLTGTTFQDNTATADGGAIYTKAGAVTGADTADASNTFTGNTAENHGGAIYVNYIKGTDGGANTPGTLTLTGGLLQQNTALAGGAISSRTSCEVSLTGTVLKNNTATIASTGSDKAGGGAIYSNDGKLTLSGVTLEGNTSGYYGGAVYTQNTVLTATDDCVVKGNSAVTGTALWLTIKSGTTATLTDMTLADNLRSAGNSNGTIYATGGGALNITKLTGTGNTSTSGGILYASGSLTVTMADSTLTGNTALSVGGVIAYRGAGTLTVTGTTMKSNTAVNGGAIEASTSGKVIIKSSTLEENTASATGGAVYATGSGNVAISDGTTLKGNTALAGGAIFVDTGASVTIDGSTLEENTATGTTDADYGGSGGNGGAIVVADTTKTDTSNVGTAATTLTMTNVTLKNNTANKQGGAISTDEASPNLVISATDCTFTGNTASTKGGGAVEIKNANCASATDPTVVTLVFKNCTFTGNASTKSTGGAIEIRTGSCAKFDGITATGNSSKYNGGAIYVTSNFSRMYLTGTVTQSGNTTSEYGPFVCLYNNNYTNPPKLYTTHSSDAAWVSDTANNKNAAANIAFDLTELP